MRSALTMGLLAVLVIAAGQAPARARKSDLSEERIRAVAPPPGATDNPRASLKQGLSALAAPGDTIVLHSANFNGGNLCNPQGWTAVDRTAQLASFWHVEDYAGLPFGPLAGENSLWCGTRPAGGPEFCQYLTLPGYGNYWDQRWCLKTCVPKAGGPTTNLDVSFDMRFDTEPSYDWVELEYNDCVNQFWWAIDGGNPDWTGENQITVNGSYPVSGSQAKVRIRFVSDSAWSDQDGLYATDGAVHIDNLQIETLALEDFEDEAIGATSSNDWESCNAAFGTYAALFKGSTVLQEDDCVTNLSCLWGFFNNSAYNYACGGHPEQLVVPYGDYDDQYINNEIWSPFIASPGPSPLLNLEFDVYRGNSLDALVFYIWQARTLVNGCPTPWKTDNFVYSDESKTWYQQTQNITSIVSLAGATHFQVALGVIDMCPFWCGTFGTGNCHSQGPLFDNIRVYRVDQPGPTWSVRDFETFQDTFASDGTLTGTARADMARDINPTYGGSSNSIIPGDSGIVFSVRDVAYAATAPTTATSGLSNDPNLSTFVGRHKTKKQIYMWVAVWPLDNADDPGDKVGEDLSEGPGGQANRYPFAGTQMIDGVLWTRIRMDYTYVGTTTNPGVGDGTDPIRQNSFNVDLNDNLFTPGDTVCYFFGATSPGGTTYYSSSWAVTNSISEVAANPMEFTILPAGGFNRGGDILYVDGVDGLGNQPYFDGAFMALGLEEFIDRYDVRGSSSSVSNRLGSRVVDIQQQLNDCYHVILWDGGSLPNPLGDGDQPDRLDDYALFNTFLGNLTTHGGIYLCGDDVAQNLASSFEPNATAFRSTYMPFALTNANHRALGLGVSPVIKFWPGRAFSDDFIAHGGCPGLDDFDVMAASGTSRVEMSYITAQSPQGAVVSNVNGDAVVILSGFSFASIRDNEADGISDRASHLRNILFYMGTPTNPPTGAGPASSNGLSQNYPNPFNPQTTISFSLAAREHVTLRVYNVAGELVRTLVNDPRSSGAHTVTWDGHDDAGTGVSSGVYFYKLVAGTFSQTRKMVLMK